MEGSSTQKELKPNFNYETGLEARLSSTHQTKFFLGALQPRISNIKAQSKKALLPNEAETMTGDCPDRKERIAIEQTLRDLQLYTVQAIAMIRHLLGCRLMTMEDTVCI